MKTKSQIWLDFWVTTKRSIKKSIGNPLLPEKFSIFEVAWNHTRKGWFRKWFWYKRIRRYFRVSWRTPSVDVIRTHQSSFEWSRCTFVQWRIVCANYIKKNDQVSKLNFFIIIDFNLNFLASPYGKCRRIRWSPVEVNIISKRFGHYIKDEILPDFKEIQKMVDDNPGVFNRNTASIKTWVSNQIAKNKRTKWFFDNFKQQYWMSISFILLIISFE